MSTIDHVFRPEQSDFEMGDVYEHHGASGVYKLVKEREMRELLIVNDNHIAVAVAQSFGCSPGDLTADDFDPAAHVAYMMGQVT